MNRDELIEKGWAAWKEAWMISPNGTTRGAVAAAIDAVEPIICTDALSRFSITEFPNGKIRTLIADGTHWVPVSTANSMVDAAKARTVERMDRYNAQVEAERQSMDDLRDKVEALGLAWSDSGGYRWVRQADVLALLGGGSDD